METERYIGVIANRVLELVPETESKLRYSLQKFIDRLVYIPPEIINSNEIWISFVCILNKSIPKITEDWHKKIQDIVNNNSSVDNVNDVNEVNDVNDVNDVK